MANKDLIPTLEPGAVRNIALVVRPWHKPGNAQVLVSQIPNCHQWAVILVPSPLFGGLELENILTVAMSERNISAHLVSVVVEVSSCSDVEQAINKVTRAKYAGKLTLIAHTSLKEQLRCNRGIRFYKKMSNKLLLKLIG